MKGRRRYLPMASALLLAACGQSGQAQPVDDGALRVLVFSHTTGWRHDSIETGVEALKALGEREGFVVEATEDPAVFTAETLGGFDVVLLLNNTSDAEKEGGEWFVGERREAFQSFVRNGGGVVGIHAASDSHRNWPWYGRMIGGYFQSHPPGAPEGTLRIVDDSHASTRDLPTEFSREDEWYYFTDFNPEVDLLVTLDPASIGEGDVNPNPISWRHEFDGGRVFYTAMGHTKESYSDDLFLKHVTGGIRWAAGGE